MGSPKHPRSPDAVLKRSFSTPDTAELERDSTEEAQSQHTAAAAEKKRNKLGYHRTSIACSTLEQHDKMNVVVGTDKEKCRSLSTQENTVHCIA